MMKFTGALLVASKEKEVGLEVNTEENCVRSCLVNRMQDKIKTNMANKFFENMAEF
jgi:hypothetical protein